MKPTRIIAATVVLCLATLLCLGLTGCNGLDTHATYGLYTYDDNSHQFVYLGCNLNFTADAKGYEMTYDNGVHIMGQVDKTPMGYYMHCDAEAFLQCATLDEDMKEILADLDDDVLARLTQGVKLEQQLFSFDRHVFSSSTVDLIRKITVDDPRPNYSSIEGLYESAADTDNVYRFDNGLVYGPSYDSDGKVVKDKDGNVILAETPNAQYVMDRGFVVLTRIDKEGRPIYTDGVLQQTAYLFATLSFPKDISQLLWTDDNYSIELKQYSEQIAGKSVGVMTKTFYSTTKPVLG